MWSIVISGSKSLLTERLSALEVLTTYGMVLRNHLELRETQAEMPIIQGAA
jgi:hypothetical protein